MMVLSMKKINILRVHWKIQDLRGGGFAKNQYRGVGLTKRGGEPWTVSRFKRGTWQERGGGVLEGGWVHTPMHTMINPKSFDTCLNSA